ncbi:excinuclease ABC, subunit A, form 2 domain protein [Burkholderia pseudomallei MSHR5596]|nr:excinuclease ABC, subunit A, form 2 domain protein [Burkholderia pseudomallei MSHR5596]
MLGAVRHPSGDVCAANTAGTRSPASPCSQPHGTSPAMRPSSPVSNRGGGGQPSAPRHDRFAIVMESCINIQYSTHRNRAAPVPASRRGRQLCEPSAAFLRRELRLTHSDGQTNCHPAI